MLGSALGRRAWEGAARSTGDRGHNEGGSAGCGFVGLGAPRIRSELKGKESNSQGIGQNSRTHSHRYVKDGALSVLWGWVSSGHLLQRGVCVM